MYDAEGRKLDPRKDADTYRAFDGKHRGFTWLHDEEPHKVQTIREWAKNRVKARDQGARADSTLMKQLQDDWVSNMMTEGVGTKDPATGETMSREDLTNRWLAMKKEGNAKVFNDILAPAAEKYFLMTNSMQKIPGKVGADVKGPFTEELTLPFWMTHPSKRAEEIKKNFYPESGEFGHSDMKAMYGKMMQENSARAQEAQSDPAGYVSAEVNRHYPNDALSPAGINYSYSVQDELGILNKRIFGKDQLAEEKKFIKEAGTDKVLVRMAPSFPTSNEKRELMTLDKMDINALGLEEGVVGDLRKNAKEALRNSDMGKVMTANANALAGPHKARAQAAYGELEELIARKAAQEVAAGRSPSSSSEYSMGWFQNRHRYLVDDWSNIYVSLPKDNTIKVGVLMDGLGAIRNNLDEEVDWIEKGFPEGLPPGPARYFEGRGSDYIDQIKRNGVWLNVPNSEGRRFILIAPNGQPLLRENGTMFTVSLEGAMARGLEFIKTEDFTF